MGTKKYWAAALGLGLAAVSLGATPALARSSKAPQLADTASITGSVTGTYGTDPYQVTGTITLEVDQTVGVGVTIGTANLNLPAGITMTDASVVVTSNEDGSSTCTGTPSESWTAGSVTLKGLGCADTDIDGKVEFTLTLTVTAATSTLLADSYEVSSQYRSDPNRRSKANAWIVSNPAAVVVSGD